MTDDDHPKGNRTVFMPSPLQGRHELAPGVRGQIPTSARQSALQENDVAEPPVEPSPHNPLLAASERLLSLLANVRSGRAGVPLPRLHAEATTAIADLDRRLNASYSDEVLRRARYALCVTGDDIALNLPDNPQDSAEFARRALAVRFFGETIGGDRFWTLLEEMIARPAENQDLLELFHACLACGFEGRFRIVPDGRRLHQETMQRAFQALSRPRKVSGLEVSPRWRGQPTAADKVGFWSPIALAAAIAGLMLVGAYIVLRLILAGAGAPTIDALAAINPSEPLTLSRAAAPPPAPLPSSFADALRTFLADEIAQHLVKVEEGENVRVRTTVGQLFKPGSEQLEPGQAALFDKIGAAIENAGKSDLGPVTVEGFTDNTPIHNATFADNTALSEARARTVADLVRARLSNPAAVIAKGYGEAGALASNDTADGRSKNRRVEVVVARAER